MSRSLSVIIPIYNSEESLGVCINSVLSQTYIDLELILVDDGSTDNSLQICKNYAMLDSRVKVISQENSGVSQARNVGIEMAEGKFIQFVDADDIIDLHMSEKLIKLMSDYDADIVICGLSLFSVDGNIYKKKAICSTASLGEKLVLNNTTFRECFCTILFIASVLEGPCNKIYKRDIFEKHDIKFPDDISLGEDFIMNLQYYSKSNKFVFIPDGMYKYLNRNNNSLSQCYRKKLFENQIMLIKHIDNFMSETTMVSEIEKKRLNSYITSHILSILEKLVQDGTKSELEVKDEISNILCTERIREAIKSADYIPSNYKWIKEKYLFVDVDYIYKKMKNCDNTKEDIIENKANFVEMQVKKTVHEDLNPGFINKCTVKMLSLILKIIPSKIIGKIRDSIINYGLKITMKKCKDNL